MLIKNADKQTLQDYASKNNLKFHRLLTAQRKNPNIHLHVIRDRIHQGKNTSAKLFTNPNSRSNAAYTLLEIAEDFEVNYHSLAMQHLRQSKASPFALASALAQKTRTKVKQVSSSQVNNNWELNVDQELFQNIRDQFPDNISDDVVLEITIDQQSKRTERKIAFSDGGIYSKLVNNKKVYFCIYIDEFGVEREMSLMEIAKLEGLKHNSLLSAVQKHLNTKSIHEIVSDMVSRREERALFELAEQSGLNRRMFIYRYNKHKGNLPIKAILELTKNDQNKLRRTENRDIQKINGISASQYAVKNGVYPKTFIARLDAGISLNDAIGRKRATSYYEFEGIELTSSEIYLISKDVQKKTLQNRLYSGWSILKAANLSVSEFYDRVSRLSAMWSISDRSIRSNAKLFMHNSTPFRIIELAQISGLSESTLLARSKHSSCPLTLTGLKENEFINLSLKVKRDRAEKLDSKLNTNAFSTNLEGSINAKSLYSQIQQNISKRDKLVLSLQASNISLPIKNIASNLITLNECRICGNYPKQHKDKFGCHFKCEECGNTSNGSKHVTLARLNWLQENTFTLKAHHIKTPSEFKKNDAELVPSTINQLKQVYSLDDEIIKLLEAYNKMPSSSKVGHKLISFKPLQKNSILHSTFWSVFSNTHLA